MRLWRKCVCLWELHLRTGTSIPSIAGLSRFLSLHTNLLTFLRKFWSCKTQRAQAAKELKTEYDLFRLWLVEMALFSSSESGKKTDVVNNRRSRTVIFFVNGTQKKLIEHTKNHFYKKTHYWQKVVDVNLVGRIQAHSFTEKWIWKSTKKE